ncbi:glycosyltransferase [Pseudoalteromonas sp. McH1-7]|uniref:glycosyltransferase n=1 Tax=unclassified Pseudoalteromonas TaxID=194690 RepID=UPI00159014B7|nr:MULTISPECIES: glycosyltransferase [unclassified Pseudoalteromonas]NUZ09602.1 glycosyltransferase [Pseudoalteromonas sp. McH1-7]USD29608.1 glycosyltransferase [Pseudoalteromonas sp. SCSIO 43201]
MSQQYPQFSIVLPTKDRPELVLHCLKLLLEQDFQNYEIIISDNGTIPLTETKALCELLSNVKVKYVRPINRLNMCENWEYAIQFAKGEWVTIISDKFMFTKHFLSSISKLENLHSYDVVTWQFEHFECKEVNNERLNGEYHPLMKPYNSIEYSASEELERRFEFSQPLFYRKYRNRNNYGKIYSGFVRSSVIKKVKENFGLIFPPCSPDFTSMLGILNENPKCLDIGISLMLVLNVPEYSYGEQTKKSIEKCIESSTYYFSSKEKFRESMLFKGVWFGHSANISADYLRVSQLSQYGLLKQAEVNKVNFLGWALKEAQNIDEPDSCEKELLLLEINNQLSKFRGSPRLEDDVEACEYEIYHSGLIKSNVPVSNVAASELASLHWEKGIAAPRKSVFENGLSIYDAIKYQQDYVCTSVKMLGLKHAF